MEFQHYVALGIQPFTQLKGHIENKLHRSVEDIKEVEVKAYVEKVLSDGPWVQLQPGELTDVIVRFIDGFSFIKTYDKNWVEQRGEPTIFLMHPITPEILARLFHETYERLAPSYGYATRKETAIPWSEIPDDNANKRLMIATSAEVLKEISSIK